MSHQHAAIRAHHDLAHGHRTRTYPPGQHRSVKRQLVRVVHAVFDRFLLLPIGAVIALVWANTAPVSYFTFAEQLSFPVNEVLMAFFFALLGQEVIEAVMPGGALHSWRRWSMPVVAAVGGMAGAVLVYVTYIHLKYEQVLSPAWPITCAIDLAATYYIMKTILPRSGAVAFALVLAITTDMVGMIVVAPGHVIVQTRLGGVALMLAALGLAALMRVLKVRAFWPYLLICGPFSWAAFYLEGLHPAFALIPIVPLLPHEPRRLNLVGDPRDDDAVHHAEHEWHLHVQPVVFLFGLVNGGVLLRDYDTGTWAMMTAALVGRPLGILAVVGIAVAAGLHLPRHVGWREVLVIAFATASGFAMALFFATGVLAPGPMLAQTKVGILGSAAGALAAFGAARILGVGRFAR
jgi:NhaA family Na+:H+ antiporter